MFITGIVLCVLAAITVMTRAIANKEQLDKLFLGLYLSLLAGGFVLLLSAKYDWNPSVPVVLAVTVFVSLQASRLPQVSEEEQS